MSAPQKNTTKINLADLEAQTRAELERAQAIRTLTEETQALLEQAVNAGAKRMVINWLAAKGLDADELEVLHVQATYGEWDSYMDCTLSIPEHMPIGFRVYDEGKDGLSLGKSAYRPWIVRTGDKHANLGHAMVEAATLWQWQQESEERRQRREIERKVLREQAGREAAERGQRYLQLLEEYPILVEMLNVLAIYVKDHERFQDDLMAAQASAECIENQLGRKLEAAYQDAEDAHRRAEDLQRDLWVEQDAHRETERKVKQCRRW